MFTHRTPHSIRAPFAKYSHAVEVPPNHRLLVCSGQLGVAPDDTVAQDTETQTRVCFANINAILADAGMTFDNVVRINAYVTDRVHLAPYMKVRDELFSEPAPASTLMIVSGFAREIFNVEIEVIAAAEVKP